MSRKISGVAVNASPASNAPPGRRTPNTTATASQTSAGSGNAFVRSALPPKPTSDSITPPRPAIPADTAKIATFARVGDIPDVRAATSELRTANIERPVADRWRLWIMSVTRPNSTSSRMIWSAGWEKSRCPVSPGTRCPLIQLSPGRSMDGDG